MKPWAEMTDAEQREQWARTRLVARIWACGDDCNCTQPIVERVSPGERFPWVRPERLWEGTFNSDDSYEPGVYERQRRELTEAAAKFGAELEEP